MLGFWWSVPWLSGESRWGSVAVGQTIVNQGMIHYDGDGINEASAPTQDPAGGATAFVVFALIEIPILGGR